MSSLNKRPSTLMTALGQMLYDSTKLSKYIDTSTRNFMALTEGDAPFTSDYCVKLRPA